jgi:hypothetical protein
VIRPTRRDTFNQEVPRKWKSDIMAAVQPNQGMPQQGGSGNAMGQQSVLPPGMTKEHVQQIYKVRCASKSMAQIRKTVVLTHARNRNISR